jgi:GT2 family glycosyltransferase
MKQTSGWHKRSAHEIIGAPLVYLRQGFASCIILLSSEAEPGMDLRFRERIEAEWRSNPKFGVLFTHYDTLSAVNMTAIRQIGPWDNLFNGYFADREYYARLRRYGFEEIQTDIRVIHHGSMTIKTDSRLGHANSILFSAYERIFQELCG